MKWWKTKPEQCFEMSFFSKRKKLLFLAFFLPCCLKKVQPSHGCDMVAQAGARTICSFHVCCRLCSRSPMYRVIFPHVPWLFLAVPGTTLAIHYFRTLFPSVRFFKKKYTASTKPTQPPPPILQCMSWWFFHLLQSHYILCYMCALWHGCTQ